MIEISGSFLKNSKNFSGLPNPFLIKLTAINGGTKYPNYERERTQFSLLH